jgi:hypothetical protein
MQVKCPSHTTWVFVRRDYPNPPHPITMSRRRIGIGLMIGFLGGDGNGGDALRTRDWDSLRCNT